MPILPLCLGLPAAVALAMRRFRFTRGCAFALAALCGGAPAARAQAGLPVITSAATASGVVDDPFSYAVTATNSPTSYFAWLPPGLAINPATGVVSGRPPFAYHDSFYVYATNASGTVARALQLAIGVPAAPWLSDLGANGNEPLVVGERWAGGVGAYDAAGRYIGSGMTYAADGLPPGLTLDPARGSLSGTPTAAGAYAVVFRVTGPSGSATRNRTLNVAAGYAPLPTRVTRLTLPANGVYSAPGTCAFQVHFSRPVVITGLPRLAVNVGGATRWAQWGGPPLSGGPFTYTEISLTAPLLSGDMDADGISIAATLDLNGGSIKDADGTNVDVALAPADARGVLVAPLPPTIPRILSVSQTATGLDISGVGSDDIVVSRTGVGVLGMVTADASGNWSFHYTPAAMPNGDYTFTARGKLRAALVYSEECPAFTRTLGASADTTAPSLSYFMVGTSSAANRTVTFSLAFDERVNGVGAQSFALAAGAGTTASIISVGPNGLSDGVAYVVTVGYAGAPGGTIKLTAKSSGSGIVDTAGNGYAGAGAAASETFTIAPDTTPPRLTSFALSANDSAAGVAEVTAAFSEPVTGVDASDFALNTTPNATVAIVSVTPAAGTFASSWVIRFNYTGSAGSVQMAIKTVGTGIADAAGNPFQGAGATATLPYAINNAPPADMTLPSVTDFRLAAVSLPNVAFQLTFTEPVTGVSPEDFVAITGGSATARVDSVAGAGTSYTINVIVGGSGTVQLRAVGGATANIRDAATHWWNGFASNPPDPKGSTDVLSPEYTIGAAGPGDTTPPTVATFVGDAGFVPRAAFTLIFSERVTGVTPQVFTATGADGLTATGTPSVVSRGTSGTEYRVFVDFTGVVGNMQLALNSSAYAAIKDAAGNALTGTAPTAVCKVQLGALGITPPAAGNYNTGADLDFVVNFNGPVVVSGTPSLSLSIGAPGQPTIRQAAYRSGTGTTALLFRYTVQAADADSDGIAVSGVVNLNGGAITSSAAGSGAIATAPTPNTAGVLLNATPPVAGGGSSGSTGGSGGGGGTAPPPMINPPPPPPTAPPPTVAQTITFNSPVSGLIVGQPIALGATSSAGLPITYAIVSGEATLDGNILTPRSTALLVVRASSAGNAGVAAASTDVNFGHPQKAAQAITLATLGDTTVAGGPFTLPAITSAGLPITYAVSGPARIEGNTIVLAGAAGTVTLRASAAGNDVYGDAAEVVRTFNVRAVGAQVYLGGRGADGFAVVVDAAGAKAVFVTRLSGSGEAIVARFQLEADGMFSTAARSSANAPRTLAGRIRDGVFSGRIAEVDTSFTANVQPGTGANAALAGLYTASLPGSASGETHLVIGATGQAYALAVTPFTVAAGTDTVTAAGGFEVQMSDGSLFTGTISGDGALRGTLGRGPTTAALVGLSDAIAPTDRLVNLSSRLRTGGDPNRTMIAGFVVTGTEAQPMLIRAVGPGLGAFGVRDALPNPRLQVFDKRGALVAENDDWGGAAATGAAADRVGAFRLDAASRDAAVVAAFPPGAYTAQVQANGGAGIALVEIYDAGGAGATAAPGAPQVINISTRGFVDTGEASLIAGFVVAGNAPKRVLIRGIGPGLTAFGVAGALPNPTLKLYAAGSSALVAQNDDWSVPQPLGAAQAAATAAEVSAAAMAAGAFPLSAASHDAAIVITLLPGAYTAVVNDAANATGAALVEVYQLAAR